MGYLGSIRSTSRGWWESIFLTLMLLSVSRALQERMETAGDIPISDDGKYDDFWESVLEDINNNTPLKDPTVPHDGTNRYSSYCEKQYKHTRKVYADSSASLQRAMTSARPGDLILVADGVYSTNKTATRTFEMKNKEARADRPITICGAAILDGNRQHAGLLIQKSAYINVVGLTVRNAAKGIKLWTVKHCMLDLVTVRGTNVEAIHIQYHSHYNTVKNCTITDTGRTKKDIGEGIYLGSSRRNYNGDECIGNKILYNTIGPRVTAEPIDIKENSKNGYIIGNILDGRDLCGCPDAVSLINVKGNGYRIEENVGKNAREDFYKTSKTIPGWGRNNLFRRNACLTKVKRGFECQGRPANGNRGNTFIS